MAAASAIGASEIPGSTREYLLSVRKRLHQVSGMFVTAVATIACRGLRVPSAIFDAFIAPTCGNHCFMLLFIWHLAFFCHRIISCAYVVFHIAFVHFDTLCASRRIYLNV